MRMFNRSKQPVESKHRVDQQRSVSLVRRVAAGVIALVGVVFLVSTFSNNLFSVGTDFEAMIDDFRPMLAEDSIATARGDLAMLSAVGTEFETGIVPTLSQQLGMTPDEFMAFTASNYPDVATGVTALPTVVPTFSGLVDTLDSQRALFESADAIPTESLPATTVPWGLFTAGLLLIGTGYLVYRPGRLGFVTAGTLGVALVATTLTLSLIPKSSDADELNANLRPVYTPELVEQASQALTTVGAMGAQMQTEMLPALGNQLGMTDAELNGFLAANFPATADALANLPDAMARFENLTTNFERNLDNYETVEPVALAPISWTLLLGGLVTMFATGTAWWFDRRNRPASRDGASAIDLRNTRSKTSADQSKPVDRDPMHV